MTFDTAWAALAACRTADPDTLFVQGAAQNRAKAICVGCEVRTECLADALDNRVEFGVWGGMTERERAKRIVEALRGLRNRVGVLDSLGAHGVRGADIPELAVHALEDACLVTNPRRANKADIQAIYGDAL